ncbi:MAG: triose-phosphate isomerase [Chlamydiota bacterium]
MAKKFFVVGNWKMYKTAREATDYIERLIPKIEGSEVNIFLAVPFTSIAAAAQYAKDTNITIGAQNMNDAREGAFTGEIAALMLKEAGAAFVMIGHSERRHVFGETNPLIHMKVLRALQDDLKCILCVGETLKQREQGTTEEVLKTQIFTACEGISKEDASHLMIAYEPVWAIGTGKTATPKLIQEAHAFCRKCLAEIFGKSRAASIPLLYGGSVKPENIGEIGAENDVDGALVGGASLDPETFAQLVQNCAIQKKKPKTSRPPLKKTTAAAPKKKTAGAKRQKGKKE